MAKNEYLDFDQVCRLFPKGEKPTKKIDSRRRIYTTENKETIYFKNSKPYKEKSIYWYSFHILELYKRGVVKVSFTISHNGIIILPITLLLEYAEYADFDKKNDYHHVRVKYAGNRYYLYHSGNNDIDITQYFIPNELDESYIEEINNKPLDVIYQEAKDFMDYENQFYYVTKEVYQRHESKKQKERIAILENHTCQICGFSQYYINQNGQKRWIIEVDHIIEKSKGGGENIDNLLVLCPNCHAKKTVGIITIDENGFVYENGKRINISNNHLQIKQ